MGKALSFLPYCLALLLMLASSGLQAQGSWLSGRILDADTRKAIPWATVYHPSTGQGTVSDSSGRFVLRGQTGDSLTLRCVGYRPLRTAAAPESRYLLQAEDNLLAGLEVVAEDPYALRRLAGLRLPGRADSLPCYFHLESVVDRQAVEMLEAWYNGHFRGYDLWQLDLKRGRIGLQPFDQMALKSTDSSGSIPVRKKHLFHSTETTKALNLMALGTRDVRFPLLPFGRSKRKLKARWWVTLQSRYRDPEQGTMEVLAFEAVDPEQAFTGRVWIDSTNGQIWQLELSIQNAKRHPFYPIAGSLSLEHVELSVRRAYAPDSAGRPRFQQQHFDYAFVCRSRDSARFEVHTRALLASGDRTALFQKPWFRFSDGTYRDYLNIAAAAPMPLFWEKPIGFSMPAYSAKTQRFMADPLTMSQGSNMPKEQGKDMAPQAWQSARGAQRNFWLAHQYHPWSPAPFRMFGAEGRSGAEAASQAGSPSNMLPVPGYLAPELVLQECQVGFQIYLDALETADSTHFSAWTVFDAYRTECLPKDGIPLEADTLLQWAVNIDFDLWEIGRRRLMEQLRKATTDTASSPLDAHAVGMLYRQTRKNLEEQSQRFWEEVRRGRNAVAMQRWDEHVAHALGRSHAGFFGQEAVQKR